MDLKKSFCIPWEKNKQVNKTTCRRFATWKVDPNASFQSCYKLKKWTLKYLLKVGRSPWEVCSFLKRIRGTMDLGERGGCEEELGRKEGEETVV